MRKDGRILCVTTAPPQRIDDVDARLIDPNDQDAMDAHPIPLDMPHVEGQRYRPATRDFPGQDRGKAFG